ncbi:MAG: 2OG-Fe(II) oxygenase [Verrucomicrobiota bacterium]
MKLGFDNGGIAQRIIDVGDSGMWSKIEETVRRKIDASPDDTRLRHRLGLTLRQQGRLEEASQAYQQIAQIDESDAEARFLVDLCDRAMPNAMEIGQRSASPFAVIPNFLSPDDREALADLLTSEKEHLKPLRVSYAGNEADPAAVDHKLELETSRNQLGVSRPDTIAAILEAPVRAALTPDRLAMCREPLTRAKFRWRLDVTPDGGFARAHQDTMEPSDRLTILYYYHTHPKRFTGGDLLLYDRQPDDPNSFIADQFTTIRHTDNLLVIFPNERFHQVTRVSAESDSLLDARLSVACFAGEASA